MKVGIIGGGVVGSAHAAVLRNYVESVRLYDIEPRKATHSFRDTVQQDILFVCLPTPMRKDGSVDRRIVEDALRCIKSESPAKAVILKSTLPPGDLLALDDIFGAPGPSFIFSPEFLTERSAEYDLQQSSHFIFGEQWCAPEARHMVDALFEKRWPETPRHWTSLEAASLVKYMRNVFFASKVMLMNEFDAMLRTFGAERRRTLHLFEQDARIGRSHLQVPGHDGRRGFGGACFLKDVNGWLHLARQREAPATVIQAVWRSNVELRGADHIAAELQLLLGRACSDEITPAEVEKLG